jgi:hypothetical protein
MSARSEGRSLVVGDAQFGPDRLGRDVLAWLSHGRLGGNVGGILGCLDFRGKLDRHDRGQGTRRESPASPGSR